MQNVILLAVVCVGFFYALYRVYKNSDGTEGSSGCGGNCMHCPMAVSYTHLFRKPGTDCRAGVCLLRTLLCHLPPERQGDPPGYR